MINEVCTNVSMPNEMSSLDEKKYSAIVIQGRYYGLNPNQPIGSLICFI
jgi:hypothetical protein